MNFKEILIEIYTFLFKNINSKMLSGKWRPSCLSLNVLRIHTALLSLDTVIGQFLLSYHSGVFHQHWGNHIDALLPVKDIRKIG